MGDNLTAAREMENAGLVAAAAIYREKATDWRGARALWSRLSHVGGQRAGRRARRRTAHAYIAALVQFNLGRCALAVRRRSPGARRLRRRRPPARGGGRRLRVDRPARARVRLLPGARRRSAARAEQFEHVLEGYINCIRILREDHLKYYALQYYEEAVAAAKERGRALGRGDDRARGVRVRALARDGRRASAHYVLDQAESGARRRSSTTSAGRPPRSRRTRSSRRSSRSAQVGQFARVGRALPGARRSWTSRRRARRTTRARRTATTACRTSRSNAAPIPAHLRHDSHFVEVWHVDLVEWEQQGSASEACADVLLDKRWPDPIRAQGDARAADGARRRRGARTRRPAGRRCRRARGCASPSSSRSCSSTPCSRRSRSSSRAPSARCGSPCSPRCSRLLFKRSFVTVTAALRDPDPAVVEPGGADARGARLPPRLRPAGARRPRVAERAGARERAPGARADRHAGGGGVPPRGHRARRAGRSDRRDRRR